MSRLGDYFKNAGWQSYLPFLIIVFVTIFYGVFLFPELAALSPDLNDNVFHYSLCVSLREEIETGGNLIDHWVPYWSMGFPVFHHYQHLPHLIVVLVYKYVFLGKISMFLIFHLFIYLLLVGYPLVLYYSLRRMNFSQLAAAGAALFSLVLSNINGYGFELSSFVWRGSGMFCQLWAMFLLPLTLSSIYNTLKENKNYFWSVILLFLLTISQVMFGLVAAITALLFLFSKFSRAEIWERVKRLAIIFGVFLVMIAYLFVPMLVDSPYHAHSTYDFPEKWDSYGFQYITTHFLNGDIMDYGRLPIATILVVLGLLFALGKKEFAYRWAAWGFILWFLLYFGRPTWGPLLNLIPLSSALHLHRFVTMVHFFGAILAGVGLAAICEKLKHKFAWVLVLALIILIASPIFWNRFLYLQKNTEWLQANKVAFQKEGPEFESMLDFIKRQSPGRVYPGRRANWGKEFKIGWTKVFYLLSPEKIPALSYLPFSWALTADFSTHFNEHKWSHCNLFNIKYILTEKKKGVPSFAREIKKAGRFQLYEVQTTGYFDLVESPIAIYADKNSIWNLMVMWMRSPLAERKQFVSIFFDREGHLGYQDYLLFKNREEFWRLKQGDRVAPLSEKSTNIFSLADPLESASYPQALPGMVLAEEAGKNIFSGKVMASKDCFLLFKMTYHPGWHAYINGREKKTVILSPGLIGVPITKGIHEVTFVYQAQWWKSFLLLLGLVAAVVLFRWERKIK